MGYGHLAQRIGAALAISGSALALTAGPAHAATTTVKATGATITRTDAAAGTTLTVKATVARLDLWCSSNKLVVNKAATAIPCNKLLSVTTTGLTGNDAVEINATSFGSSLPKTTLVVKTGAGNDTINVRHNGSLTVYAGAGNDKVGAGLASGSHPVSETLLGEDGNDTLTNYGFITAPRVAYAPSPAEIAASKAVRSVMRGGPGTDRYVEDDWRWSDLTLDAADAVTRKWGPATYSPERATTAAAPWSFDAAGGDPYAIDTLTMGTATSLDIRCVATSPNPLTRINGLTVPEICAQRPLLVLGTSRADTVTYDQKIGHGYGNQGASVSIDLGAGDDVATARIPWGSAGLSGGPGNDRLAIGLYNSASRAQHPSGGTMNGGDGTDTLTNLGFLDPNPPVYDPAKGVAGYGFVVEMNGAAGADRLVGAANTIDSYWVDPTDTLVENGGPSSVNFRATAGPDDITVTNRNTAGTTLDIGTGAATKRFTLSPLAINLNVYAVGGDDNLSVLDGSKRTAVFIDPGDGIDALTTRFIQPWTTTYSQPDGSTVTVVQAGYQPVSWYAPNLELKFNFPE